MIMFSALNGVDEVRVSCTGHAEYGEKGKDIVCAAASMLMMALVFAVSDTEGVEHEVECREGKVFLKAIDKTEKNELKAMVRMAKTGFRELSRKYPENVCVVEGELS